LVEITGDDIDLRGSRRL